MKTAIIVLMLSLGLMAKTSSYGRSPHYSGGIGKSSYSISRYHGSYHGSAPKIIITDYSRGGDYYAVQKHNHTFYWIVFTIALWAPLYVLLGLIARGLRNNTCEVNVGITKNIKEIVRKIP